MRPIPSLAKYAQYDAVQDTMKYTRLSESDKRKNNKTKPVSIPGAGTDEQFQETINIRCSKPEK